MRVRLLAVLVIVFHTAVAAAEEPRASRRLDWDTGENRSYYIPALEVTGFVFSLNAINRVLIGGSDYDSDVDSFDRNLKTAPVYDKDPFSINQIGHPYQGGIYYGFARSAGLEYWESLLYTLAGSFLWETYGETTPPSINDYISTTVGGSFVGEALFRMAGLLLEGGGGEQPGFWRELGAAVISPPTAFNRLVFGERFKPVFPSRDPEVFIRLRLGATITSNITNEDLPNVARRQEASLEYSISYGLPGKPGYRYRRPFDYFHFEFTVVPNADSVGNAVENLAIRGLLAGDSYEWGPGYRGLWGLFGSYEYISPQIFRIATTAVSLGTVAQWWISPTVALQGTVLGGVGFGASGTVADPGERDYHYGVIPEALVGLRLIFGERALLEGSVRQYFVAGVSSGGGPQDDFGPENVTRGNVGLTFRLFGPHAIGLSYVATTRDARFADRRDRHQSVETVSLSYNFLGHTRFGATEWRPAELAR